MKLFCPPGFSHISGNDEEASVTLRRCIEGTCGYWYQNESIKGTDDCYLSYCKDGHDLYDLRLKVSEMHKIRTEEELNAYLETQYAISLMGVKTFANWREFAI